LTRLDVTILSYDFIVPALLLVSNLDLSSWPSTSTYQKLLLVYSTEPLLFVISTATSGNSLEIVHSV